MFKKNLILYLVFGVNTVYAVQHGFTWPYWITAGLTALAFALDIVEVMRNGRD